MECGVIRLGSCVISRMRSILARVEGIMSCVEICMKGIVRSV